MDIQSEILAARQDLTRDSIQKADSKTTFFVMCVIIISVSLAVYFNALFNGFVYDDNPQVVGNPWIRDIKYLPDIFSKSVHSFQNQTPGLNYYRPVMHVIYLLNYYVFGLKAWGFHLVNILFHAGVSVLIFSILFRILSQRSDVVNNPARLSSLKKFDALLSIPFLAAMLFATHPIHTEAVTWVAGLPDLSFSFFCLLSFLFYITAGRAFNGRYLLSLASYAIAMFCKETAVTFPLILVAYDYAVHNGKGRFPLPWLRYVPYLVVIGFYMMARILALGGFAPAGQNQGASVGVINIFPLFALYLEKLLLPLNLNFSYSLQPLGSIFEMNGIVSVCISGAFVLAAIVAMKKNKLVFFSLVLIMVPLLPVFYLPGRGVNSFGERYLYLPAFGFTVFLALVISTIQIYFRKSAPLLFFMAVLIIGLYSVGTVKRNPVWKDDETLFTDVVMKSPGSPHPHYYLGMVYLRKGDNDKAIEQLQAAIKLGYRLNDGVIYHYLGLAFFNKGLMDECLGYFESAVKINPDFVDPHIYLGMVYGNLGNGKKAIEQFQTALKLQPGSATVHFDLALAEMNEGLEEEALKHFEDAVKLDPGNPEFRAYLARAYERRNFSR